MKHLILLTILIILSNTNCDDRIELETKFGQEGTTFGDGQSCYRDCDGTPKICYYKFKAERYSTMGTRCGDCGNNVTSDCFNPECIFVNGVPRNVLTINRRIPGPTISVCLNDEIIVDAENHLGDSTLSLHWHGLHQVLTPWMDGVPMVTQCPILPGNKFRYRFRAEQPGTQLWHSHSGVQKGEGIFGRLNVRQPKKDDPNGDLYDFDEDQHSILLTDWLNRPLAEYLPGIKETPIADSVLTHYYTEKPLLKDHPIMGCHHGELNMKFNILNHVFDTCLSI